MFSGGVHGLQPRWRAACAVLGGFDSLLLPPNKNLDIELVISAFASIDFSINYSGEKSGEKEIWGH